MSGEAFKKRFGFARSNTSGEPSGGITELTDVGDVKGGMSTDVKSMDVGADASGFNDGDAIIANDVRRISEVEAHTRLRKFRREHQFDPNLPDDAFDEIDETTTAHNAKGEAELVGELVENSPYPEVSRAALLPSLRTAS